MYIAFHKWVKIIIKKNVIMLILIKFYRRVMEQYPRGYVNNVYPRGKFIAIRK